MTDSEGRDSWPDEADQPSFKTLTAEEAKALKSRLSLVTPWQLIGFQALVGLLCTAAVWVVTQRSSAAVSALYGALTVVLPGALMARGLTRGTGSPAAAVSRFVFWELTKIALAAAMLVVAAVGIPDLSWPALLVAMVVCMKLGWLALLWRRR